MLNQVKVSGKLTREPYLGNSKSGPYAAGTLAVSDGKYDFWLGFYAPGAESVNVFRGGMTGEVFEIHGALVENKRNADGQEKRTIQVKADKAFKLGSPAVKSVDNGYITDNDIPF